MTETEDTFLALDIGGTNVKSGLVTRGGELKKHDSFPTSDGKSPAHLIELIARNLKKLWNESASDGRPKALAIGAPGWIKPKEGIVVMAPNIPGWRDLPITRLMSQALDIPAVLENDANLYALGEWSKGAGQGRDNQITLTLGTGVGGGLILDGKIWNGSFTSAAEVGHIPLVGNPRVCGCGRVGCLETVASALGMASIMKERIAAGHETLHRGDPNKIDSKIMMELAGKKDPLSLRIFREAGEAMGYVLSFVFNLLGLETAVIGGGGAGAFEFMEESMTEILERHVVTAVMSEIAVVRGALGGNAPLIGAAALLNACGH
ncbi:MAG: ROK family protein [Deltaproteobacteria bacterium]|nr:ROK family protein [Deltaproteobacteria bacterium]